MLTKQDLNLIRHIIREEVPKIVHEETKHLPTSNQFFTEMDKIYTKLTNIEDDRVVQVSWKDDIEENKERITKVEKHLHIATA